MNSMEKNNVCEKVNCHTVDGTKKCHCLSGHIKLTLFAIIFALLLFTSINETLTDGGLLAIDVIIIILCGVIAFISVKIILGTSCPCCRSTCAYEIIATVFIGAVEIVWLVANSIGDVPAKLVEGMEIASVISLTIIATNIYLIIKHGLIAAIKAK